MGVLSKNELVAGGVNTAISEWAIANNLGPTSHVFNLGDYPSVNVDNFFDADEDPEGDYTNAFERASLALSTTTGGNGGVILVSGVRDTQYIKLRTGIKYVGASVGSRLGTDGATIRALSGSNTPNFIYRENNSVKSWGFENIVISGNKTNNGAVNGLYLYQLADGFNDTNDDNEYPFIVRTVFRDFLGDGWLIDGDGVVDGKYYNIKNMYVEGSMIRACDGLGVNVNKLSDSRWAQLIISGCKKGAASFVNCSNNHFDYIKGFYNGITPQWSGSFRFSSCKRSYVNIVAQEEYMRGVYFNDCFEIYGYIQSDANGYPNTSQVEGMRVSNTRYSHLIYIADSFHAPDFLQGSPLTIRADTGESIAGLTIEAKSANQTTNTLTWDVNAAATVTGVNVDFNGTVYRFGSQVTDVRGYAPGLSQFQVKYTGDATGGRIDHDIINPTGAHNFGKWRNTTKVAGTSFNETWYKGDGTLTTCHKLHAGGNAEFCRDGNFLYNGGHLLLGADYELFSDNDGFLRYKKGAPSGPKDGYLIGNVPEPIYISGNYMFPPFITSFATGSALPANRLALQPLFITKTVTISELFAKVITVSAGGSFQIALYNGSMSTGKPTTLITNTSNLSTDVAGNVSGVLSSNVTLPIGFYWMAIMCDNTTATFLSTTGAGMSTMIGHSSLSAVGGTTSGKTGYYTTSTYGTWPADLTAATLTAGAGNSTDAVVGWRVA